MPTRMKLPSGREIELPDAITIKPSLYQPSKAELEEEFSLEKDLGYPVEELGETDDERLGNLARIVFRQVKVQHQK